MAENLTTTTQIDSAVNVFYDRVLLKNAKAKLVHGKFAQRATLPKGSGTTYKWRRYNMLAVATTPLTEGVTPTGQQLSKIDLTVSVSQYGDFVHITDKVLLTSQDPVLTKAAEELGDQEGRTFDQITRDILVSSASATTCSNGTGTATLLNKTDIDSVVQTLLGNDASMITDLIKAGTGVGTVPVRAAFWGIAHTDLINDIEAVSGFKSTSQYPLQSNVDEAEWGSTGNVRWLVSSVAHSLGLVTDPLSTGTYYYCPIIGKEAYGIVELGGGNSKNIVKPLGSAGTADPLNQRATSGWKAYFASRILNDLFVHVLRCTNA